MNEEALRTEYLKTSKDVTCFMKYVKISRSKSEGSNGSLSYRTIRKAWRKTQKRKELNKQIYLMANSTIPTYFPELLLDIESVLDNNSVACKIERIRYQSAIGAFKEDPFTKEFKDIIRRIRYNCLHNKHKPIPSLDTIKLFKESYISSELPSNNDILREISKYTAMCYNY